MSALTSRRTYAILAADAAAAVKPIPPVAQALEAVELPRRLWPVLPVVKAASALGLLSVYRFPKLARLTTLMLTVYFVLATGSHIRARDWSPGLVAASSFLGLFGAMTVKGPSAS